MRRGADTRGGEGVLSRIGFDEFHQLLHRLGRNAGVHEQAVGRPRGLGDRREVLVGVVGRLGVEARIDGVARRHEQDRVAVARRPGGGAHTEIAASPCHVLDVELLAELFRQLERNEPSHHIGRPRGRERYDDLDRPIGISRALRKCGGGKEKPHADGEHTGVRVGHSHERSPWFSGDAVASGSCTITRSNELLARPNVVRGDDRVQRGQFGDDPYLACAATALNVADTYGSSDMSF